MTRSAAEPQSNTIPVSEGVNPLRIPEIADYVLRLLSSTTDLKNCRLVNSQWCKLSFPIMTEKNNLFVTLSTISEAEDLSQQTASDLSWFPCRNVILNADIVSDWSLRNLEQFQLINLKRLVITNSSMDAHAYPSLNRLLNFYWFLFHLVPQLEELSVDYGDTLVNTSLFSICWTQTADQNDDNQPPQDLQLSNLKICTLSFKLDNRKYFTPLIRGLLGAANNLRELNTPLGFDMVDDGNISIVDYLMSSGRIHIIKELVFDLQSHYWEKMELLNKFADNSPSVRIIHELAFPFIHHFNSYRNQWYNIESCFNKIFKASSKSLSSVFMHPMGFLTKFQLPSMSSLQNLSLFVDDYEVDSEYEPVKTCLLSSLNTISCQLFSALKKVNITWKSTVDLYHEWEDAFPSCKGSIASVECLKLQCVSSQNNWLQRLSQLFPCVKNLQVDTLHCMDTFQNFCDLLFSSFCKLEKIEMYNIWDEEIRRYNAEYLDSCLTGIYRWNYELFQDNSNIKDVKARFLSIRNLQNLKSFTLGLSMENELDYYNNNNYYNVYCTHKFWDYLNAFELFPNLSLNCECRQAQCSRLCNSNLLRQA